MTGRDRRSVWQRHLRQRCSLEGGAPAACGLSACPCASRASCGLRGRCGLSCRLGGGCPAAWEAAVCSPDVCRGVSRARRAERKVQAFVQPGKAKRTGLPLPPGWNGRVAACSLWHRRGVRCRACRCRWTRRRAVRSPARCPCRSRSTSGGRRRRRSRRRWSSYRAGCSTMSRSGSRRTRIRRTSSA